MTCSSSPLSGAPAICIANRAKQGTSLTAKRLSNVKGTGRVPVPGQGYLATFTFQPSEGATGAFSTAVKEVYSVSCLNDSADVLLASGPGEIELIGVGVGCPSDEHCERVACQTGTCVNYECDGNGVPDMCDLADAIPPASTWGLIILTLLLLTGAKVVRVLPCGAT